MADIDLTNIGELKKLMERHNTGTKKSFGQNFLINPSLPKRIAVESCDPLEVCTNIGVIEIGAGAGTLSYELCRLYKKVVAIEVDRTLLPVLGEVFDGIDNFKVVCDDILKIDLKDLVEREFNGFEKINICANLPYYITTPVITYILESGINFGAVTFMIQKEVASKLCAKPGSEDYGAITLLVNYYGTAIRLFDVPPSSFYPPPKVTSSVVRIIPHESAKMPDERKNLLFRVIRAAFEQRRKTLVNALSSAFANDEVNKADISSIVENISANANIRGEMLGLEEFIKISDGIFCVLKQCKHR